MVFAESVLLLLFQPVTGSPTEFFEISHADEAWMVTSL